MALTALADGAVLAERVGTEPPRVLALHGWGRTRADLLPVVTGRDALVPDLPGFGASPPPPEAWGSADYADLLAAALDDRPWVVLGHSLGGRIALQLAARHPDKVAALVLTGVPSLLRTGGAGKAPLAYRVVKRLHRLGVVTDARMEAERKRRGSADYRAADGVMRDTLVRLVNEDYGDLLTSITTPVRMVWGAGDTAAPVTLARQAQALFPDAQLEVVEGSRHLLDAALVDRLRAALGELA